MMLKYYEMETGEGYDFEKELQKRGLQVTPSSTRQPIPIAIVRQVRKRDGWRCLKCGRQKSLVTHHIQMVMLGGTNDLSNLATLCNPCHYSAPNLPDLFDDFIRIKLPPDVEIRLDVILWWLLEVKSDPHYNELFNGGYESFKLLRKEIVDVFFTEWNKQLRRINGKPPKS